MIYNHLPGLSFIHFKAFRDSMEVSTAEHVAVFFGVMRMYFFSRMLLTTLHTPFYTPVPASTPVPVSTPVPAPVSTAVLLLSVKINTGALKYPSCSNRQTRPRAIRRDNKLSFEHLRRDQDNWGERGVPEHECTLGFFLRIWGYTFLAYIFMSTEKSYENEVRTI